MKIAVLGGGFTGLTAAYVLAKKGNRVTVFEKEKILGGLAIGFRQQNWQWFVERTIHHLFNNDTDIFDFCREIGFDKIVFRKPETASLYETSQQKFQTFPLDTPVDMLRFGPLSLLDRIRAGLVLAFLKLSPPFPFFEKMTAQSFLKKTMGEKDAEVLFGELFRKKFGKFAGNILASFIWARIKKRTKKLGYIKGGFQALVNYLREKLTELKVNTLTGYEVNQLEKKNGKFLVNREEFDVVISTLPTPTLIKLGKNVLPQSYLNQLRRIKYLHAVSLILETAEPILKKTYWLNICTSNLPLMGLFQQTNFMDKKYYGGHHILYCDWYVSPEDRLWKMEDREILELVKPRLKKISNFKFQILNYFVFHAPFAQPIFDQEFLKNKPDFVTPTKNFFIANLDMTYPCDRGTNYAVKLGKQVAELL